MIEGLLVFEGMKPDDVDSGVTRAFALRPGEDKKPPAIPSTGEISRLSQTSAHTVDPVSRV